MANHSAIPPSDLRYQIWERAVNQPWENITKEECYITFSAYYVHDYKNVILVTNISSLSYGTSWLARTTQSSPDAADEWPCGSPFCPPNTPLAANWRSSFTVNIPDYSRTRTAFVQYCISESIQPSCAVELSPQLLIVAIVCNVIKVVILVLLLCSTFKPMVTIGDAIASYIDEPDPSTQDWGAISARDLYKHREPEFAPIYNPRLNTFETHRSYRKKSWRNRRSKYFSGAVALELDIMAIS